MINLVSADVRKEAMWEYWTRVVSVWAFLLSGAMFVVVALLIPTYVLTNIQLSTTQQSNAKSTGSEEEFKVYDTGIKEANALATQLMGESNTLRISEVLGALKIASGQEILLKHLIIEREGILIQNITVEGVAESRLALSEYKKNLERAPLFSTANVPTSDLARVNNLPFAIKVMLADNAQ